MKLTTNAHHAGELLSALADSQLTSAECTMALDACKRDPSLLDQWSAYHLAGDVLRSSSPVIAQGADMAFVGRLQQRIAAEALLNGHVAGVDSALRLQPAQQGSVLAQHGPVSAQRESPARGQKAANDASFRWKMVAGVASIAAVSAMVWSSFGALSRNDAPQLALDMVNEQVLVASPMGPMVRDARLEEQLAEHRQLGSAATLQMPSEFFRNAAFGSTKNDGR